MKCKHTSHVTDVFNMLSLSLPTNEAFRVSGYIVPYLFSEKIKSFEFETTERLKYSDMLQSIGQKIPSFTDDNYKMYFMLSSRVVGRFLRFPSHGG